MSLQGILDNIYLTPVRARAVGFTHEGLLFGLPAWFYPGSETEEFMACPKLPALQLLAMLLDKACELASYFMRVDQSFEVVKITGEIPAAVKP